jgi:hypothetical protein
LSNISLTIFFLISSLYMNKLMEGLNLLA